MLILLREWERYGKFKLDSLPTEAIQRLWDCLIGTVRSSQQVNLIGTM
jgi:hypothetical protein